MQKITKHFNWKLLGLIFTSSYSMGFFVDQLVGFNNYTYFISGLTPALLMYLYREYLFVAADEKTQEKGNTAKWKHRIFSFVIFAFITAIIFRAFALLLGIRLYDVKADNKFFIAISLTSIIVSVYGDRLLYWGLKEGGLIRALDSREYFFNQNNIKIFIYSSYFFLLFITNSGLKSESIQLWINTFATYVAFERIYKYWQEQEKKNVSTNPG